MNSQASNSATSQPVLSIAHLVKTFGEKRAVDGISLEVLPGDIFGFIGPNGAGKSTLIRCAVGISPYDSGTLSIAGHSVKDDSLACKRITAYVPDNPDIYEFLTGIQYLTFVADIFAIPSDLRHKRIEHFAKRLALTEALGDLVSSYSHGMRQKLVIIGALIHQPTLLVLDEPFVGLDPEASYHVKEILRELAASGSAVFFSSHVLEVVEKLCNKVALIKDGVLQACGDTASVVGDESLEEVFLSMVDPGEATVSQGQGKGVAQ